MGVGATFLTSKNFDRSELITVLKNSLHNVLSDDQIFLKEIISNFEKNDFSLITPQQIDFLEKNDKSKWADYLIFRYKFTTFPKNLGFCSKSS